MEEITKEITFFISSDGKEHLNKYLCESHEEEITEQKERDEFLSEIVAEKFNREGLRASIKNNCVKIEVKYRNGWGIPDECLDAYIDLNEFGSIEKELSMKYKLKINIPSHYWSK